MRDVSIIIPTYNRPDVLEMTFPTYCQPNVKEILIMDDCSDLDYSPVVNDLQSRFSNLSIRYYKSDKHLRQSAQKQKGAKLAEGKYVMFGEDDVFLSNNYVGVLRDKIITAKENDTNIFVCGQIYYNIDPATCSYKQVMIQKEKHLNVNQKILDKESLFGDFSACLAKDATVPFGHSLYMVESQYIIRVNFYTGYKANSFREESDAQLKLYPLGLSGMITPDCYCCHLSTKYSYESRKHYLGFREYYYGMKSNRIFWRSNLDIIKKYINPKPSPSKQILLHNICLVKSVFNRKSK